MSLLSKAKTAKARTKSRPKKFDSREISQLAVDGLAVKLPDLK
jgi:hypothetical protein